MWGGLSLNKFGDWLVMGSGAGAWRGQWCSGSLSSSCLVPGDVIVRDLLS